MVFFSLEDLKLYCPCLELHQALEFIVACFHKLKMVFFTEFSNEDVLLLSIECTFRAGN